MQINEIFKSIEGEGVFQGYLTLFIRFSGCNLRCKWCDTKYAFDEYKDIPINVIMELVKDQNINKISITGGEPFLQYNDLIKLINNLKALDKEICIYTNGTIRIDENLFDLATIQLDYKLSDVEKINKDNLINLKNGVLKFVIDDIEKFKNINIDFKKILNNNNKIHITPAYNIIDNELLANYIIDNNLSNFKLSLQQHKYIWKPDMKGV